MLCLARMDARSSEARGAWGGGWNSFARCNSCTHQAHIGNQPHCEQRMRPCTNVDKVHQEPKECWDRSMMESSQTDKNDAA